MTTGGAPSEEDLKTLLAETNFTEKEIRGFYCFGAGDRISEGDFIKLCAANGLTAPGLVARMWDVFDSDDDGSCSDLELVKSLNPLMRGTLEDVAGMFFELYDVDGDNQLTVGEIVAVYSDLVRLSTPPEGTDTDRPGLNAEQRLKITKFVREAQQDSSSGKLDKEAFTQVVRKLVEEAEDGGSLLSPRNLFFVFITSWSEVGTSFALPAMGALSARIQQRFDCGAAEIGQLTALYYLAAMVGPMIGGLCMDKVGPGLVVIGANVLVTLGAMCQAVADGASMFWLLTIGRLLLGLGGEVTPFTSVEILGKLFPDYFGLMAGVRNLIQSTCGFLAFVLLPMWADYGSADKPASWNETGTETRDYMDNEGTTFALWVTVWLGVASTLSNVIVKQAMDKEAGTSENAADTLSIQTQIRAFAKATAPQPPQDCAKWKLPPSFFLACVGIKAQYFAPFGFTAFSNAVYGEKFGQSAAQASFLSGVISLVAGLLGPIMGPLSDKNGQRSSSLGGFTALSMLGFIVLAISGGQNPGHIWFASFFFALQYGFGDTVAYISIRLIVGPSRAGIGYGVYGIIGNLLATLVPLVGGIVIEMEDGNDMICWYFAFLMFLGSACWVGVRYIEGPVSFLELPAEAIVETDDEHLQAACLTLVIDGPGGLSYADSVEKSDTFGHAQGAEAQELRNINPFITAKFGVFTKGDRVHRTLTVRGNEQNGRGLHADFSHVDGKGVLVSRTPGDAGVCIIDVWHDSLMGPNVSRHIASTRVTIDQVQKFNDGVPEFQELTLYGAAVDTDGDGDIDEDDDVAEGKLRVKLTYHSEIRRMELEFGTSQLPDIREQHLCDALTFHESNIIALSLMCFAWYLIVSTIFYDMFFRECKQGPNSLTDTSGYLATGTRIGNSTAELGLSALDSNATGASELLQDWGSGVAAANCTSDGGLNSFLDALVFQFTTFTTVGYGTHPVNFKTDTAMLLTVTYILTGMVILGVMAGAVGQKMLLAIEKLTDRVELFLTHALSCIQDKLARKAEEADDLDASTEATTKQYSPIGAVISACAGMGVILGMGTWGYSTLESPPWNDDPEKDMSGVKAFYFTVVTVTTVGFGDIAPESDAAKIFSIFFVPVGVIFFAKAMSAISDVPIRNRAAKLEAYVLNQFLRRLTTYDLNALQRSVDLADDAAITKNDFCLAVLLRLGRVSPDDLERIESIFFALDRDRSGALTPDDLKTGQISAFDTPSPRAQRYASTLAIPRETKKKDGPLGKAELRDFDMFDNPTAESAPSTPVAAGMRLGDGVAAVENVGANGANGANGAAAEEEEEEGQIDDT